MGVRALFGAGPEEPEVTSPRGTRRRAAAEAAPEPDPRDLLRAQRRAALRHEVGALAWLALAIFLGGVLLAAAWSAIGAAGDETEAVRGPFGAIGTLVATPLLTILGWTGALFLPFAPFVHALRRFGRLSARDDRNWLLFLAGCALLTPVVVALALRVGRDANLAVGVWGAFVAFYAVTGFGAFGAWLLMAFALCALTIGTLAWNPVRALLAGRPVEPALDTDDVACHIE